MAVYRRSSRTRNVLAVLVLAALTLITVDARSNGHGVLSDVRSKVSDAFSPLQRATHAALAPVGNFLTGAVDYGSLRKENQQLRLRVAQLQTQSVSSAAAAAAAQQVLKDAHLPFAGGIPGVAAQVIDSGSSNFDYSVTINKGTSSGIAAGEPVVAAGGLVGTVVAASSGVATVRLLVDPSSVVGVALQGGNTGSATGQGLTLPIRVSVFARTTGAEGSGVQVPRPVVKRGDVLVTSGLSMEKYPPGIPIGKVTKVSNPPGASEPDIFVAPLVNLRDLSFVRVLLWSPQSAGGQPGGGGS